MDTDEEELQSHPGSSVCSLIRRSAWQSELRERQPLPIAQIWSRGRDATGKAAQPVLLCSRLWGRYARWASDCAGDSCGTPTGVWSFGTMVHNTAVLLGSRCSRLGDGKLGLAAPGVSVACCGCRIVVGELASPMGCRRSLLRPPLLSLAWPMDGGRPTGVPDSEVRRETLEDVAPLSCLQPLAPSSQPLLSGH